MSIIEYIGSVGGVTGVLAFLIFMAYRYLVNQMRQDRMFMEDRLTKLMEENFQIRERSTDATVKHAQVLSELITWLKEKNGSK